MSDFCSGERSVSLFSWTWCNGVISGNIFVLSETAAQKRTFSLYLLCLIQERGQEKWLMDQNIDFSWTGGFIIVIMHDASLRTQSQSAVKTPPLRPQGLPSNRCYEIMRDLSQWINNWTVFFTPLCCHCVTAKHCCINMLRRCRSFHCTSDHRTAAEQEHMRGAHCQSMQSIPTAPSITCCFTLCHF